MIGRGDFVAWPYADGLQSGVVVDVARDGTRAWVQRLGPTAPLPHGRPTQLVKPIDDLTLIIGHAEHTTALAQLLEQRLATTA